MPIKKENQHLASDKCYEFGKKWYNYDAFWQNQAAKSKMSKYNFKIMLYGSTSDGMLLHARVIITK